MVLQVGKVKSGKDNPIWIKKCIVRNICPCCEEFLYEVLFVMEFLE